MNENLENDIEIVKVKKKKKIVANKTSTEDKKKIESESIMKITPRTSLKFDINTSISSNNQKQNIRKSAKRRKSDFFKNRNFQVTSIDSLKATLESITEMVIKQEADILEAVTGCQEPNSYQIYGKLSNGEKIHIFNCREFSSCGMRYFCPVNCREFYMKIKIPSENEKKIENNEDEEYENSLIEINKNCKCPFLCCIRPDMKVILNDQNKKLGVIEQAFSCCDPVFNIYDKDNNEIFYIEADCCQCGFLCRNNFMGKTDEAHFFIYNYNDRSNAIGDICKKAAKSLLSIADNYSVILPNKATFEEKILLTVAGIMIDYQYFEKNTSSQ